MIAVWLAMLQTVDPPAPVQGPALVTRVLPADCPPGDDRDEIIVCGRDDGARYRLKPLPDGFEDDDHRAAFKIIDKAEASVEAEQGRFDPQIMVRLKIPF